MEEPKRSSDSNANERAVTHGSRTCHKPHYISDIIGTAEYCCVWACMCASSWMLVLYLVGQIFSVNLS